MLEVLSLARKWVCIKPEIELAAKALHDYYVTEYHTLGEWDTLSDEIKQLNRAQIINFPKLRESCGDDPKALACAIHEVWRSYTSNKSHKSNVAYDDLPEAEQQKDLKLVKYLLKKRLPVK
jgi:hypothetical protein